MVKQDEPISGIPTNTLEPVNSKTSDIAEVKEVQGHATYHEAIAAAPFQPWSKSSIQLYFIFLVAYVNAMASGFDGVSHYTRPSNAQLTGSQSSAPSMQWSSIKTTLNSVNSANRPVSS
jgi:hypothetical protein